MSKFNVIDILDTATDFVPYIWQAKMALEPVKWSTDIFESKVQEYKKAWYNDKRAQFKAQADADAYYKKLNESKPISKITYWKNAAKALWVDDIDKADKLSNSEKKKWLETFKKLAKDQKEKVMWFLKPWLDLVKWNKKTAAILAALSLAWLYWINEWSDVRTWPVQDDNMDKKDNVSTPKINPDKDLRWRKLTIDPEANKIWYKSEQTWEMKWFDTEEQAKEDITKWVLWHNRAEATKIASDKNKDKDTIVSEIDSLKKSLKQRWFTDDEIKQYF